MAKLEITQQIREEYGTLKRYARIHGLHYELLKQVIQGLKVSKACKAQLQKDGYMS